MYTVLYLYLYGTQVLYSYYGMFYILGLGLQRIYGM
jgi:hypothetical protein